MKSLVISLLPALASLSTPLASRADEVIGTAYAVIFKTDPPTVAAEQPGGTTYPRRRYPQNVPTARLSTRQTLAIFDTSHGRELSRSPYDPRLGAYVLRLPMQGIAMDRASICLVLKGTDQVSLPIRDEQSGDDGYAFRNPRWEAELKRSQVLSLARAELTALKARLALEEHEYDALGADAVLPPPVCSLGPVQPEPLRTSGAFSADEVRTLAGGVCAIKWTERLGANADVSRLYRDAKLDADWDGRANGQAAARAMPELAIEIGDNAMQLVVDAANKGSVFLQHADGLRRFSDATQICKLQFATVAATALAQWDLQRDEARAAPEASQRQCKGRVARAAQLRQNKSASIDYSQALDKQIASLERSEPSGTDSTRIDRLACKEF